MAKSARYLSLLRFRPKIGYDLNNLFTAGLRQMDRQKLNLSWQHFSVLSLAYIVTYAMLNGFISPLQKIIAPDFTNLVSLLFLPHGVRVLAIYYFGWRAVLYLIPASLLMWFLAVYGGGENLHILGTLISLVSCYAGVSLTRFFIDEPESSYTRFSWRNMVLAGFIASLFNSFGLSALYYNVPPVGMLFGFVFGDMAGQMVMMFILLLGFRLTGNIRRAPHR